MQVISYNSLTDKSNFINFVDFAKTLDDIFLILLLSALSTSSYIRVKITLENAGRDSIEVSRLPLIDRHLRSLSVSNPEIVSI
jgi:hypothetical protein